MGALSNIDQEGFASAAFHSFPSTLRWDAYSGDYGPNFFGHAVDTATYLVDHPDFGWQAFGGSVSISGSHVRVVPQDSFRQRVYVAPIGLWLTLDAGTFQSVELDSRSKSVRVVLSPADSMTPKALLRVEQPAKIGGVGKYRPSGAADVERGAYSALLSQKPTVITLKPL